MIGFAALGLACSLSVGWLFDASLPLLIAVTAVYGFATIGDSTVLSSEMTNTIPVGTLGKALGLRSILGIGAGGLAPVGFGLALDLVPGATGWVTGFTTLGVGGLIALICAINLPRGEIRPDA